MTKSRAGFWKLPGPGSYLEVTWKLPGSYLEVLEETMALHGAVSALIPTRTSLEAHEVPVPASSTPPGLVSLTPQGPQGYG